MRNHGNKDYIFTKQRLLLLVPPIQDIIGRVHFTDVYINNMNKMSILKSPIDYKVLQDELYEELKANELYKLQNDAKIRAVEQGVPTYEHFRQMVSY